MLTNESGDNISHRLIKSINNIEEDAFSSSDIEHESDMSGNEPKVV